MDNGEEFFKKMNEKQQQGMRSITKWAKRIFLIMLPIILLGGLSFSWITDYIWMDSLGFENVYTTILTSKVLLGAVGFLLFLGVSYFTLKWIHRSYVTFLDQSMLPDLILNKKTSRSAILIISIILGLIGMPLVQALGWEPALKVINFEPFNEVDPYFGMDISFYLYVLPFLQFVINLFMSISIFALIGVITAYSVFGMYKKSRLAQTHIVITVGFIGLLLAGHHLLQPYETLLTNQVSVVQNSVVHGLSYTDDLINIPKAYVLAAAAIIATIWMIIALSRGRLIGMIIPVAAYVLIVLLGQGASMVVQQFVVSPNEFSQESPYLENNIDLTRQAYGLNDITVNDHPGNYTLDEEMIERNEGTISNVRINDARPLLDVYNQRETFRQYYEYNDIDVDRYVIDGEYQQVFTGARELNTSGLPDQAKTWVNENLRYTHGYGITMSHANQITNQGLPEHLVNNIPPEGELNVERPQIYFGEETNKNVIVNAESDEFDYPAGEVNESTRFSAESGIELGGLNRLLFAIKEGSFRMFVSDQLSSESQFLETRDIMERVNRIAPFFDYDQDPYIVVRDDGSLAWIIDAYLTAENYPYSENYEGDNNFIRNSVKVVVDAYTGEVDYYVVDEEDPLLKTYANIFPDLFSYGVPEDIQAHFRYPEMLFKIQADMYGTYHMSNLEVFYNREDAWEFPTEKYFDTDITMEPYYITMQLQEEDTEEFVLMLPYTPKNRQNMIAWMGVRNDGENYGELMVHRFPKQRNIYGPQQIENRINQDSTISQQLNLWSQGGSSVIRGNLIVLPIEDTVMYVEPIYIESSNATSLPEVKQIVIAYGDYIVMEETFDRALNRILQLIEANGEVDFSEEDLEDIEDPALGAEQKLQDIAELFENYQEELSNGNWTEAAEILVELENELADEMPDELEEELGEELEGDLEESSEENSEE
ncbi:membrane protein [Halalkalibacillus sediminis]|uniref:UPF0182 protein CEY16_06045 n=1 Tax=Halalkalibacillus sediminis TaxID=2018042 RepID=A0A2I0QYA7_9BACI|nr:UPF0182 family protein [Halalkalibacillus sediminis]PKR79299.1 membrane protein [Halalkalibacillus sediminis]